MNNFDKDEQQKRLDTMMRRREKIEQQLRFKPVIENGFKVNNKKWSLENSIEDYSDDSDVQENHKEKLDALDDNELFLSKNTNVEDDVDPLDQFMKGINKEIQKHQIRKQERVKGDKNNMTDIAKKLVQPESNQIKDRVELLEQNQDSPEYSSEEDPNDTTNLQTINSLLSSSKAKKLNTVDGDDITYLPFEKKFYVEVSELAQMTEEGVDKLREKLESIKVKGENCPKPIKHWSGVNARIFDALKRFGFDRPTPIQAQAIPAIMSGRDVIAVAKKGSGKTLAFLLPMFEHVLAQPPLKSGDGPIALIVTPTREIATQITVECEKFAESVGLRVVTVCNGKEIKDLIGELKPGAEIVVCTPDRMIDMLAVIGGRVTNLKRCKYLVLDDADEMFDLGFESQVNRIIDDIRTDKQTVICSATFSRTMETLARRILQNPIEIIVGGKSIVCKDIEQDVIAIEYIAGCSSQNRELELENAELKDTIEELNEKNLELSDEIDLMDLRNQELNDKVNTLTNELNSLKLQNIELAKHAQEVRLQLGGDRNQFFQLERDYSRLFKNYDLYHRAYLDSSYFIDSVLLKLEEIDCTAGLLCKKFKLDRNLDVARLKTVDYEHQDILNNYLKNIEFKLDNLLLDDDKI